MKLQSSFVVSFLQCKLVEYSKKREKEEKGEQIEAGEMKERKREVKQGSCSVLKEVVDVLNRKTFIRFSRVHTCTKTHTHTLAPLPLRFNTGADASQ